MDDGQDGGNNDRVEGESHAASGEWIAFSSQSSPTTTNTCVSVLTNSNITAGLHIYRVRKKLGFGSFGDLYIGEETTSKVKVAIKIENLGEKNHQLANEFRIYQVLGCAEGRFGFPLIYDFVQWREYNVLIMELLGRNLEDIFHCCKQNFSLKSILYVAQQLIDRFEYIHACKICYRDVKPENFLLGHPTSKQANTVYVVDFGLSNAYIDANGGHIAYREGKNLTGTARYMSINSHNGIEQSRRDDLEALAHVFIYFLRRGQLPWSGLKASKVRDRYRLIGNVKQDTNINALCKGHASEFGDFLRYARKMSFEEAPDYPLIRSWFRNLFVSNNYREDGQYEWSRKL